MAVCLRDAHHAPDDQRWIQNVYPEYIEELTDLSASNTGVFPLFGEHGPRDAELFARWFRDKQSHPLLILDGTRPVGFALVSRPLLAAPGAVPEYRLADFFIRRLHRRRGIGRVAAGLIFGRFSGRWLITETVGNTEAVAFWRAVLGPYTGARYRERIADGEVHQTFETAPAKRP
jgi:predicted acetyltransferase